jgi:hypothetical protein
MLLETNLREKPNKILFGAIFCNRIHSSAAVINQMLKIEPSTKNFGAANHKQMASSPIKVY